MVAANRIAHAILEKHHLRSSLKVALQCLIDDGKLEGTLGVYRGLMVQRDVTEQQLSKRDETFHRDSFIVPSRKPSFSSTRRIRFDQGNRLPTIS